MIAESPLCLKRESPGWLLEKLCIEYQGLEVSHGPYHITAPTDVNYMRAGASEARGREFNMHKGEFNTHRCASEESACAKRHAPHISLPERDYTTRNPWQKGPLQVCGAWLASGPHAFSRHSHAHILGIHLPMGAMPEVPPCSHSPPTSLLSLNATSHRFLAPPMSKRSYKDAFLRLAFTSIVDRGVEKPQCVICSEVLSNESLNENKLKRHLQSKHLNLTEKGLDYFKRREQLLKP